MEGRPAGGAARARGCRRGGPEGGPVSPPEGRPAFPPPAAPPRLPEDPSGLPPRPEPLCSLAAAYGNSLAWRGRALAERLVPLRRLQCYFAVDTRYVGQKLARLLFPFGHQDWQVRFQQDPPVAPRFDVNAPDLYIPVMAFITYLLVAGLALGTQNRFSPDLLGLLATSALAWLTVEVLAVLLCLYLAAVHTALTPIDLVAFSGYKYVGMIAGLLAGLVFGKPGYYMLLGWCCVTIFVFTIRSLRLKILSKATEGVPRQDTQNQMNILHVQLSKSKYQRRKEARQGPTNRGAAQNSRGKEMVCRDPRREASCMNPGPLPSVAGPPGATVASAAPPGSQDNSGIRDPEPRSSGGRLPTGLGLTWKTPSCPGGEALDKIPWADLSLCLATALRQGSSTLNCIPEGDPEHTPLPGTNWGGGWRGWGGVSKSWELPLPAQGGLKAGEAQAACSQG